MPLIERFDRLDERVADAIEAEGGCQPRAGERTGVTRCSRRHSEEVGVGIPVAVQPERQVLAEQGDVRRRTCSAVNSGLPSGTERRWAMQSLHSVGLGICLAMVALLIRNSSKEN